MEILNGIGVKRNRLDTFHKGKKPGTVPEFFSTQQASGGRFEA
jgi:hypothetical protein